MTEEIEEKRVLLEGKIALQVSMVLKSLREEHCRVNASQLVDAILKNYFERHYKNKRERTRLEKLFFNKRAYLRDVIQRSDSDEEINESLKVYNKRTKSHSQKKVSEDTVGQSIEPDLSGV